MFSRVNEAVPHFLVEGMKRRLGTLASRKVAVLGLTFKRDTDDERDSLSPKLIRLLERELADFVRTSRPDLEESVGAKYGNPIHGRDAVREDHMARD